MLDRKLKYTDDAVRSSGELWRDGRRKLVTSHERVNISCNKYQSDQDADHTDDLGSSTCDSLSAGERKPLGLEAFRAQNDCTDSDRDSDDCADHSCSITNDYPAYSMIFPHQRNSANIRQFGSESGLCRGFSCALILQPPDLLVTGPGVRIRTFTFPLHNELEGYRPLADGSAAFITSSPDRNFTIGKIKMIEPKESFPANPQPQSPAEFGRVSLKAYGVGPLQLPPGVTKARALTSRRSGKKCKLDLRNNQQ